MPALSPPRRAASPSGRAHRLRLLARRTPLPQPGLRCYSSLQAGSWAAPDVRGARRGGGSTHPALPVGRRSPPPARQALQPPAAAPAAQLCSAPGNLLFRARACKIGQTGWEEERLKENGTGPFKICRFLFLWSLRPFPSARTKAQGEERGKETSTPSKGRHGTGEVKRKGSLDDNLYFPVCGGCDVLETEIRRKDSALPSLRVPETHGTP